MPLNSYFPQLIHVRTVIITAQELRQQHRDTPTRSEMVLRQAVSIRRPRAGLIAESLAAGHAIPYIRGICPG
jgi:hypothetical protein